MTNLPGERPLNNPPEPTDGERAIREAEHIILGSGQPDVFEILAKLEPHLGDQPAFRELVAKMNARRRLENGWRDDAGRAECRGG